MQQCIKVEVAGRTCHLIYNNQAMFALQEKFPQGKDFMESMSGDTRENYEAMLTIFEVLAEQANLVRSYYGYPPEEVPDTDAIRMVADPGTGSK